MMKIHELIRDGALGRVFAIDVVFHNAYGPDKQWFYDPKLSGGGCVIDLGIHLVDLALWAMDFPRVEKVSSRLFTKGAPLRDRTRQVEDFATARIDLANDNAAYAFASLSDQPVDLLVGSDGALYVLTRSGVTRISAP